MIRRLRRLRRFPAARLPRLARLSGQACAWVLVLAVMASLPVAVGAGATLSVEECVERCKACACIQDDGEWICSCLSPR